MSINERIKAVRSYNKMNQKDFSSAIGVSQSYLSEAETGKSKPSIDIFVGIANRYNDIDCRWLLTGEGPMHRLPPPAPTPPPEPKQTEPPKKPVLRLVEMPKRPDSRLAMMLTWLESWWVKANSDERVWCDIQMTRCFPEYKDYRQAAESENDLEGGLDGA